MFTVKIDDRKLLEATGGVIARLSDIPAEKMQECAAVLIADIKAGFEAGGLPEPWLPSKKPQGKTLIQSGRLMNSGSLTSVTKSGFTVTWGQGLPYAVIHQVGGTIPERVPVRAKALRWIGADGKPVFRKRAAAFQMPARRYVKWMDSTVVKVKQILSHYIIEG